MIKPVHAAIGSIFLNSELWGKEMTDTTKYQFSVSALHGIAAVSTARLSEYNVTFDTPQSRMTELPTFHTKLKSSYI